ncbi:hypothetical protein [Amycolatopsis dendrobii]|uniref:Uncharacterized protein n=1 Tax=Amycolatopsis dendrobii TaxID=2760662 RepID=A0A7W3VUP1_9PSEU|nr:hypothetical protein [Amycolatopsis dendrobii]MBB1153485.1 hypothetical protein [Amycolatopsis dendrobii]
MSKLLRTCNPDSPEYLARPRGATRVFRADHRTIGVQVVGRDVDDVPFFWEFDLYEGWAEQGRTEPPPVDMADAAWRMGLPVLDYLAAPGSATAYARRTVTAERRHAVEAAEPLVSTLRLDADRAAAVTQAVVEILLKLTKGNEDRARELLDQALLSSVAEALPPMREAWHAEDFAARFADGTV